jgi:hypothetical protein
MKNIIIILLSLFLAGILWLSMGLTTFSEEVYVNPEVIEISRLSGQELDINYLKQEFEPAYEF